MSFFATASALSKNGFQGVGQNEGANVWKLQTTIVTPNNFQPTFDVTLNYNGNYLAIGDYKATVGNLANAGQVTVYSRGNTNTWELHSTITEPTPVAEGRFGVRLCFDETGNNILISRSNKAYLFNRSGNTWTEQANINPFANVANFSLASIAINNNASYMIAGGVGNVLANINGKARIYTYASNTFTFQQELDPGAVNFGISFNDPPIMMNGDGDKVLVTNIPAEYYTVNAASNGTLWYYTRSNTTWNLHTTFTGNIPNSGFARSFGLSDNGNYIVIGAPFNYGNGGNIINIYSNVSNTYTVNQTITGGTVGGGVVGITMGYAKNESWLATSAVVDTVYDQDIDFLQKDGNGNYQFVQGLYNPAYQDIKAMSGDGNYLAVWDWLDYNANTPNASGNTYAVLIYTNTVLSG